MEHHKYDGDLSFDHCLWWDEYDRRDFRIFHLIVVQGEHDHDLEEFARDYWLSDPDNIVHDPER